MKRTGAVTLTMLVAVATAATGSPQADLNQLAATVARLSETVRELRADVTQQKLKAQEETIAGIVRELDSVEAEREKLDDMERGHPKELQSVIERLTQTTLPDDERNELEALRASLQRSPARIESRRQSLIVRKERLQERLQVEQDRKSELIAAGKRASSR